MNAIYNIIYFLFVEILNGKYKGQKPTTDVRMKTIPSISKIIPKVPVTIFVKYRMPNTRAIITLSILSTEPMFFFIISSKLI